MMAGLPVPGVQYAAGEDSDNPDADDDAGDADDADPASSTTIVPPDMGRVRKSATEWCCGVRHACLTDAMHSTRA